MEENSNNNQTQIDLYGPRTHKKRVLAAQNVPAVVRSLFENVYGKTPSKALAIKAKCIECCGFENYRDRINTCSVMLCPLWGVRPYVKWPKNNNRKPPTHLYKKKTTQP